MSLGVQTCGRHACSRLFVQWETRCSPDLSFCAGSIRPNIWEIRKFCWYAKLLHNILALSEWEKCRVSVRFWVFGTFRMMFLPPQSCKHPSASHALAAALEWKCILRWANSGLGWHSSSVIDFAQETKKHQSRFCLKAADAATQCNMHLLKFKLIASHCCLCFYQPLGLQIHPGLLLPVLQSPSDASKWHQATLVHQARCTLKGCQR